MAGALVSKTHIHINRYYLPYHEAHHLTNITFGWFPGGGMVGIISMLSVTDLEASCLDREDEVTNFVFTQNNFVGYF